MPATSHTRGKYRAMESRGGREIVRTNDLVAAKALARVTEGVVTVKKRGKEVEIYNGGPERQNPYGQLWFEDSRKRNAAWKKLRDAGFRTEKFADGNRLREKRVPAYFLTYSGSASMSELEQALGVRNPSRRNPEAGAAEKYEEFHGKPSDRIIEIAEEVHEHLNLTELGDLVVLKVRTVTDLDATISFETGKGEFPVKLACSEDGKQLFFVGGSQELDLATLEMDCDELIRDSMLIGELYMIHYVTKKAFDKMEETEYFHEFSEEGGPLPVLILDYVNQKISMSGGSYEVKPEGIVN